MWLASGLPLLAAVGFLGTRSLWLWFVLELVAGVAGGMRWVLAEAFIAEFAPGHKIGRFVGTYATLVGLTFVIGPMLLAWVGSDSPLALWMVIGLLGVGLVWTGLIPQLPLDQDAHTAQVGVRGLWQAVWLHPVVMLAGFVGGFFELGLASILPLYGLTLGLSAATSAMLVSVSGMGGMLVALPAGMVADRFASPAIGRRWLMQGCAILLLLASGTSLWTVAAPGLVWPVVAVWGAAGGALYTLVMVDIGAREKGITLVNSTAVLVLTYTLGGLMASGVSGALLDQSPTLGFPAMLIGVAATGLAALTRRTPPGPMH
jgi:MFS family permease